MKTLECIAGVILAHLHQIFEEQGKCLCKEGSTLEAAMKKTTIAEYQTLRAGTIQDNRYLYLAEKVLQGDNASISVLDMAIGVMLYPEFGVLLKQFTLYEVTVKNGWMAEGKSPTYDELLSTFMQCSKIFSVNQKAFPFFDVPCFADNRLINFLLGGNQLDGTIQNCCTLFCPTGETQISFAPQTIVRQVRDSMQQKEMIQIKGVKGCGKKELLKYCAQEEKRHFIFINFAVLDTSLSTLFQIRREAFFYEAYLCFDHVTQETLRDKKMSLEKFSAEVISYFSQADIPICFCTDDGIDLSPLLKQYLAVYNLRYDTREDSIKLWTKMAQLYHCDMDAVSIGSRFRLNKEQMEYVFSRLVHDRNEKIPVKEDRIAQLCRQMISKDVEKGDLIEPDHNMTIDRLIIPAKSKETIYQICNHVWYAQKVYQEWGMEQQYFYGKGVPVLFSGPAGTGKTMAAYVISHILEMPLYKVDLSQIVDKYIGETEKHLQKIFDFASHNAVVLFFDEADALFGKRSEIKDARDRYANTEISYLLQKVEQYDGIVILASNLKNNMDSAFTRRMKYFIPFTMPDVQMRYEIWTSSIPFELPTEQLDFNYLAKQFELSGGNIKNILLAASFDAAGKHEKVGMKHILLAIKDEYMKYEKQMTETDFGEYYYLLK